MYEDLVKALLWCTSPHGKCEECSYFKKGACRMQTQMDAADAIETLIGKVKYLIERCNMADKNCAEAVKMGALWKEAALEQKPRWIPVTERLPENGESVLMYYARNAWDENGNRFRRRTIDVGFQYNGIWHVDGCSGVDGIAWMPLPEPPKEETDG